METTQTLTGQIVKALSGFYYVEESESKQVYQTRGRGQFRNTDTKPLVGDYVTFVAENKKEGLLTKVATRHNEMIRPPVANVDLAFLVASVNAPEISPKLIDRYLVYLESLDIEPVLYLSKVDTLENTQMEKVKQLVQLYEGIGYTVFLNSDLESRQSELEALIANKTVVAVGQSGVGKSTFLNAIIPEAQIETAEVSKALGRGRHTTRHTELHDVWQGKVADTPGFSNIDIDYIAKEKLDAYFPEMRGRQGLCKFRECTHQHEPKCAIKAAVDAGDITQQRYDSFKQMYSEIEQAKPVYHKKNNRK